MKRRGFLGALLGLIIAPTTLLKTNTSKQETLPELTKKKDDKPTECFDRYHEVGGSGSFLGDHDFKYEHLGIFGSGVIPFLPRNEPRDIGDDLPPSLPELPKFDFEEEDIWNGPLFPLDSVGPDTKLDFVPYVIPNCGYIPGSRG